MPDDDDKTLQLRALVALDQERGRTDDLSFAFLTEYKARVRAEQKLREMEGLDALVIAEVREQLATSEAMRAALSHELQCVRIDLMEAVAGAARVVTDEFHSFFQLDAEGFLSDEGREEMHELKKWLDRFTYPQPGQSQPAPPT